VPIVAERSLAYMSDSGFVGNRLLVPTDRKQNRHVKETRSLIAFFDRSRIRNYWQPVIEFAKSWREK